MAEHRGEPIWLVVVAPWCGGCSAFVDRVVAKASRSAQGKRVVDAKPDATSTVSAGGAGPRIPADSRASADSRAIAGPKVIAISATERGKPDGARLAETRVPVLVDRDGSVLALLDPADVPWVLLLDEDGRITASGGDIDGLSHVNNGEHSSGTMAKLRRWWKR